MEVDAIVSKLRKGDKVRIAEIVGCSRYYVSEIMAKKKPVKGKVSKKIIRVAQTMIAQREALTAQIQKEVSV